MLRLLSDFVLISFVVTSARALGLTIPPQLLFTADELVRLRMRQWRPAERPSWQALACLAPHDQAGRGAYRDGRLA